MAEKPVEEHSSPIKTPRPRVLVVLAAFLVPIVLIVMISQLVTSGGDFSKNNPGMSDEAIASRIKPVGVVAVVDPNAPRIEKSGKEVVDAICAACHAAGALNAPRIGDRAAWGKLAADGLPRITQNAIKGARQMPPRGGNPELSDIEIARAIVYMANQSGARLKEPAPKPAPKSAAAGDAGKGK
jgi:cytochrome c5